MLGLGEDILPILSLLDGKGQMRATLVLRKDGAVAAIFFDGDQQVRLGVGVRNDGLPDIVFYDRGGKRLGGMS